MTVSTTASPVSFRMLTPEKVQVRQWLICLSIALLTLAVRLPFLHFIDDDEAFYSLVAQRWLHGDWPYTASFDVKPPLLFGIFALAQAVFGESLATIKGVEIVFTIWGAIALQRLLQRQGAHNVSLWAGGLFPVLSLAQQGTDSANVILLAPFIISAFSALSRALEDTQQRLRSIFLAGLWIGLAGMVKQTAIFEAVGLAGFALWSFRRLNPVGVLLVFAAGAALPAVGFGCLFAAAGHFHDAFQAVVPGAAMRGGLSITGPGESGLFWIVRFILLISPLTVLSMASLLAVARCRVIWKTFSKPLFWLAVVWVVSAAAGCIASQSALRYYGSNLIAPLLILSGACILSIAPASLWRRYAVIGAVVAAMLACVMVVERQTLGLTGEATGDDYQAARATAAELVRLGYTGKDELLVPRRGLFIYLETGTLPHTRYFHTMHLACHFPTPDTSPFADALAAKPRFIVLSDPFLKVKCETAEYQLRLDQALKTDYRLAAVTQGQWVRNLIYEIRPLSAHGHPDQNAQ